MEITRAYVKSILPHRDPEGHKGTFGKVYCLCGAVGYTGAPVLAGRRPQRQRPGVSGGAGGHLAHRGGEMPQRHALSPAVPTG